VKVRYLRQTRQETLPFGLDQYGETNQHPIPNLGNSAMKDEKSLLVAWESPE
jgi:hypothetical protein